MYNLDLFLLFTVTVKSEGLELNCVMIKLWGNLTVGHFVNKMIN